MFRGVYRDCSEIWPLVRFHIFLYDLILKTFRIYSIDTILHSWESLFIERAHFLLVCFLHVFVFFTFFS